MEMVIKFRLPFMCVHTISMNVEIHVLPLYCNCKIKGDVVNHFEIYNHISPGVGPRHTTLIKVVFGISPININPY